MNGRLDFYSFGDLAQNFLCTSSRAEDEQKIREEGDWRDCSKQDNLLEDFSSSTEYLVVTQRRKWRGGTSDVGVPVLRLAVRDWPYWPQPAAKRPLLAWLSAAEQAPQSTSVHGEIGGEGVAVGKQRGSSLSLPRPRLGSPQHPSQQNFITKKKRHTCAQRTVAGRVPVIPGHDMKGDPRMEQCWNTRAGEREYPEKNRRQAASSSTIPTSENPVVNPPSNEVGSPWWEASTLATAPQLLLTYR
ncbi:hypothetical protein PR048_015770 [Dryococelus australis]|uniref:Uncharacterized protein n=1 Tax=Dryococelus australis TaxID=614101 RepID=A0ABQ9HI69_9NEOP|nr:hypothetical protein PR048_015770 [Dryococelus australis]